MADFQTSLLQPGLVPVPAQLFQGSLLLGGLAKLGLGSGALADARRPTLSSCRRCLPCCCLLPARRCSVRAEPKRSCRPASSCRPVPSAAFALLAFHSAQPRLPLPHPDPTSAAEALSHAQVFVSPLLVGGWCGLITTALNCLPVGNLDGGRAMLVSLRCSGLGVCACVSGRSCLRRFFAFIVGKASA
jgi:hypothetical protein